MAIATMTSKGQITLPAATRAKLKLLKGTRLEVTENDRGQIVLTPQPAKTGDIRALRGILKYEGPPVSIADMDMAVLRAASRRFRTSVE